MKEEQVCLLFNPPIPKTSIHDPKFSACHSISQSQRSRSIFWDFWHVEFARYQPSLTLDLIHYDTKIRIDANLHANCPLVTLSPVQILKIRNDELDLTYIDVQKNSKVCKGSYQICSSESLPLTPAIERAGGGIYSGQILTLVKIVIRVPPH